MKTLKDIAEDLSRAARGERLKSATQEAAIAIRESPNSSAAEKITADVMTHAFALIQVFKSEQDAARISPRVRPVDASYPIMRLEIVIENALHNLGLSI